MASLESRSVCDRHHHREAVTVTDAIVSGRPIGVNVPYSSLFVLLYKKLYETRQHALIFPPA